MKFSVTELIEVVVVGFSVYKAPSKTGFEPCICGLRTSLVLCCWLIGPPTRLVYVNYFSRLRCVLRVILHPSTVMYQVWGIQENNADTGNKNGSLKKTTVRIQKL